MDERGMRVLTGRKTEYAYWFGLELNPAVVLLALIGRHLSKDLLKERASIFWEDALVGSSCGLPLGTDLLGPRLGLPARGRIVLVIFVPLHGFLSSG